MKNVILFFCFLTLLSCGGSDNDDTNSIPEIDTRVELYLDSFLYREYSFSNFQKLELPLNFVSGEESLWGDYSYKPPVEGRYKISLKVTGKYINNSISTIDNIPLGCQLLNGYGISFFATSYRSNGSSGFGLGSIEICNEFVTIENTVEKNLTLEDTLVIDLRLKYPSSSGTHYVALMDIDIYDCQVIIEKL